MVTWNDKGRFHIINKYRSHIRAYAIISFIGIVWSLSHLSTDYIIHLVLPFIISVGYVIPFRREHRLRDINYIKIFLISIVWAYISIIPIIVESGLSGPIIIYGIEKCLFLLAITIPFDIRDKEIDGHAELRTIPDLIGIRNSYILSISFVIICTILHLQLFDGKMAASLLIADLLITLMIILSSKIKNDYMYSGLLDGSFLVRFLLIAGLSGISLVEIWS